MSQDAFHPGSGSPWDLVDHHGQWCCWCLDYIEKGNSEQHHVVRLASFQRHFAGEHFKYLKFRSRVHDADGRKAGLPFNWTVPVHRGSCHREMQNHANAAAYYLLHGRLSISSTWDTRDHAARWFHERGIYWYGAIIGLDALYNQNYQYSPEQRKQIVLNILSGLAVTRGSGGLPAKILSDHTSPGSRLFIRTKSDSPDFFLAESNIRANRGYENARDSLRRAQQLADYRPELRSNPRFQSSLVRRLAQLSSDRSHATEAINMTEQGSYSRDTARLYKTLASVCVLDIDGSDGALYHAQMLANAPVGSKRWLYYAESLFVNGVVPILKHPSHTYSTIKAYKDLVAAQYICAVLGIQMDAHRNIPLKSSNPNERWSPRHVLEMAVFSNQLRDPRDCFKLRQEALQELSHGGIDLKRHLLDLLSGFKEDPSNVNT